MPKATTMMGNGQSQGWLPPLRDWGDRDMWWGTAGEGEHTQISWCHRKQERTRGQEALLGNPPSGWGPVDGTCELYKRGTNCSPMEMALNKSS